MAVVYQAGLGIQTGDIVRTSYATGPYRVASIWGPRLWHDWNLEIIIFQEPIVSLGLSHLDGGEAHFSISEIWRDGDRWFSSGSEVFVTHDAKAPAAQLGLFGAAAPAIEPYPFTPGVDYSPSYQRVWRCDRCGHDFNGMGTGHNGYGPAECPACGAFGRRILVMPLHPTRSTLRCRDGSWKGETA
jgi:DNA-directed RNA polymerase subunit RPC12/RpoP